MSKPQSLFSKEAEEAYDALMERLKARRDNPMPVDVKVREEFWVLPPSMACDYHDNSQADEDCETFLNRRFDEGYRFKDRRWGK